MKLFATLAVMFIAGTMLADDKKDLAKLTGKWQATSMQVGKAKMPDAQVKNTLLTMDGDKYTVTIKSDKETESDKGTVKVDTKAKPMTMDITGTDGPNKGKTFLAIYELEGDNLKICYDLEGKKRPTEFKATGDKILLATYKKQK